MGGLTSMAPLTPWTRFPSKPRHYQTSRLLNLCGEIRNQIYRHVLLEENATTVTSDGVPEPALLRVCRAVRNEAIGIYYCENRFSVMVQNYDPIVLYRWILKLARLRDEFQILEVVMRCHSTGIPNWTGLLRWIELYHRTGIPSAFVDARLMHQEGVRDMSLLIIGNIFALADVMNDRPWEIVDKVARLQRPVLAAIDQRWNCD